LLELGELLALADLLELGEPLLLADLLALGVIDALALSLAADGLALFEGDGVDDRDTLNDGDRLALGAEGDALSDPDVLAVADGLALTDTDGEAETTF
jgi:hypothetical protein